MINKNFTKRILIGLIAGIVFGLFLRFFNDTSWVTIWITNGAVDVIGKLFITAMKMLVVPVVLVSLVTGIVQLGSGKSLGRMGVTTIVLYLFTTALAIAIALFIAHFLNIGKHEANITASAMTLKSAPTPKMILTTLLPSNPIKALAQGNMLQIIIFAVLLGLAINFAKEKGKVIANFFISANEVIMTLIHIIMWFAPIGVFCLLAHIFARLGFEVIRELLEYFVAVVVVLLLQASVVYSTFIFFLAGRNPITFFKNMFSAMLFAFSTASSSASIPVTLETVITKLKVPNKVASFVIPLGATLNMDGTAIMQGVATVFIAHFYQVPLTFADYLIVIAMATLASVGTAGVPGVGLITLAMVLRQVGLPVEGIALIIGVDRLLDMLRTAINICGDSMISCIVARWQGVNANS